MPFPSTMTPLARENATLSMRVARADRQRTADAQLGTPAMLAAVPSVAVSLAQYLSGGHELTISERHHEAHWAASVGYHLPALQSAR